MPHSSRARGAASILAVAFSAAGPAGASPIENAVDVTSFPGFVSLAYGDHTVNAGLASPADVDGYRFNGVAGEKVRLVLHSTTSGFDAVLRLRGGATVIQDASCSGGSANQFRCSTFMDVVLPSTQQYTINVFDNGLDETGQYGLHVDRYPPTNRWKSLVLDTDEPTSLGHFTDSDYFAFQGQAGTGIKLSANSQTFGLDVALEIWDPAGTLAYSSTCSGGSANQFKCVNSKDLDLTATGIYRVNVFESGWDETGGVSLRLACNYGDCAVGPIPEPGTWLLMLAGAGGLAASVRRRRVCD